MPCYDSQAAEDNRENARKVRELPPLLCSACRALDRLGYDFDENPALSQWWDKHKAEDARRQAAEEAQAQRVAFRKNVIAEAMKKKITELSIEEINILKEEGIL